MPSAGAGREGQTYIRLGGGASKNIDYSNTEPSCGGGQRTEEAKRFNGRAIGCDDEGQ